MIFLRVWLTGKERAHEKKAFLKMHFPSLLKKMTEKIIPNYPQLEWVLNSTFHTDCSPKRDRCNNYLLYECTQSLSMNIAFYNYSVHAHKVLPKYSVHLRNLWRHLK